MSHPMNLKVLIETTCGIFRAQLDSRRVTQVEEFVSAGNSSTDLSDVDRRKLLVALISAEIQWKRQSGVRLQSTDFATRFPEFKKRVFDDLISLPESPPKSLPPQDYLPPHYRLLNEIGQGGIGVVWRVVDERMKRELAIKSLKPSLRGNWIANQRLAKEAELTGRLQHPGVPPVFEQGVLASGACFFAMKLVEGRTLGQMLDLPTDAGAKKRTEQEIAELISVFEQIAQTLGYAHAQGVIHRDVKPENVMVGEFGEVQVMDWGMAKDISLTNPSARRLINSSTHSKNGPTEIESAGETADHSIDSSMAESLGLSTKQGDLFGTPAYMSPEQAIGDVNAIDYRSDVFGLGHLLFEILTGQRVFGETSASEILKKIATGNFASVRQRLNQVPADSELVDLCCQCLKFDPDDRAANAGEVAVAIEKYQTNVQQRLKQAQIDQKAAEVKADEERKRRRVAMGLSSAVLVAIAAGLMGVLWQLNQANQARKIADQRFLEAKNTVDEYLVEVSASKALLDSTSGTQELRRKLLNKAKTYYENFVKIKPDDPMLRDELAEAFLSLGKITSELVSDDEPIDYFDQAIEISMKLIESNHARPGTGNRVLQAMNQKSLCLVRLGNIKESLTCCDRALAFAESDGIESETAFVTVQKSDLYRRIALAHTKLANEGEAEKAMDFAILFTSKAYSHSPDNPAVASAFATTLFRNGTLKYIRWKSDDAKKSFEQAIEIYDDLNQPRPENKLTYQIALSKTGLAETYWQMGDANRSIDLLNQSSQELAVLSRENPALLDYFDDFAEAKTLLAKYMRDSKREGSLKITDEVIASLREKIESHPNSVMLLQRLAYIVAGKSETLRYQSKNGEALKLRHEALVLYERLRELAPDDSPTRRYVVRCFQGIGVLHRRMGELEKAQEFYGKAISMIAEMEENGEVNDELLSIKAGVSNNLAFLFFIQGRYEDAVEPFRWAIKAYSELADGDASRSDYYFSGSSMTNLGVVFAFQFKYENSLVEFDRAVEVLEQAYEKRPSDRNTTSFLFESLLLRSQSQLALERFDECERDLARCLEVNQSPYRMVAELKQLALEVRQGRDINANIRKAVEMKDIADQQLPMSDVLVETARVYLCAAIAIENGENEDQEDRVEGLLVEAATLFDAAVKAQNFAICSKRFQDESLLQPFRDREVFADLFASKN